MGFYMKIVYGPYYSPFAKSMSCGLTRNINRNAYVHINSHGAVGIVAGSWIMAAMRDVCKPTEERSVLILRFSLEFVGAQLRSLLRIIAVRTIEGVYARYHAGAVYTS